MTNVLLVCSGGMSSAIVEKALVNEAKSQGKEINVKAIGSGIVREELDNNKYDVLLVAPQVKHMFNSFKQIADDFNIPTKDIAPREYSPLGSKALLDKILN
ncbi:MAG: PTS sugar transporter subunit IIB [Bifidobacteriaceae bacterium]|jgi:PTS system cellobiose-specific IIB component|nr:PTS sugar transporter subunit IIB [Bifidobacteriaceae bacterium]